MSEHIATIIRHGENENCQYFDKNGVELFEGDYITLAGGEPKKLYRTAHGELGTDATNHIRILLGVSVPCESGVYPLDFVEMAVVERVDPVVNPTAEIVCKDGNYRYFDKNGEEFINGSHIRDVDGKIKRVHAGFDGRLGRQQTDSEDSFIIAFRPEEMDKIERVSAPNR